MCYIGLFSFRASAQQNQSLSDSTFKFGVNSLNGIEFKYEMPTYMIFGPTGPFIPIFLDYNEEIRITRFSTLLLNAGLIISPGLYYETLPNDYEIVYSGNKSPYCSFGLNFEIEPRCYLNYLINNQSRKAKINSGLFLSLPLEVSLPDAILLSRSVIYRRYNSKWLSGMFNLQYSLGVSAGYRHPLSNCWSIEGSMELQLTGDMSKYGQNITYYPSFLSPQIEIRATYLFNKR